MEKQRYGAASVVAAALEAEWRGRVVALPVAHQVPGEATVPTDVTTCRLGTQNWVLAGIAAPIYFLSPSIYGASSKVQVHGRKRAVLVK